MGLRKRHKLRKQPALSYKSVREDDISRLGRSSRGACAAGGCKRSGGFCNKRSCKSTSTKLHGVSPLLLGGVTDQCATPKPGAHADSAAKQSVEMRLV